MKSWPKNIIVSGPISSGKTSFGRVIEAAGIKFIKEPLDKFEFVLNEFYRNKKEWAASLQITTMSSRFVTWYDELLQSYKDGVSRVFERSVEEDYFIFAKPLHEAGLINDINWKVYCQLYDALTQRMWLQPTAYIILEVSPETALTRVKEKRKRSCELQKDGVTLEYLQFLHTQYKNFPDKLREIHGKSFPTYTINTEEKDFSTKNIPGEEAGETRTKLIKSNEQDFNEMVEFIKDIVK